MIPREEDETIVKFRAFDLSPAKLGMGKVDEIRLSKCNCHVVFIDDGDFNPIEIPKWRHYSGHHENCVLMQSTGLKDKNGVEIYEGDIVKSYFIYNGDRGDSHIYVVEHDTFNPTMVLVPVDRKNSVEYDFVEAGLRVNEIIGNRYENPELLKEA